MTDLFAKETLPISLESEMKHSYLDYAMSVIVGRALPDVRDGLKPVHRRVLYAMHELKNDWNKPHKKSSRVVGDVIGKYHPHGDTAVYHTIVRMAQDFSLRYMLVDGQGNFGSVDGDNPAAMRYTEVRMAKIGHELLVDLDKETVDFVDNYDGAEQEPVVLPTKIPNLLVNGSAGIAVGMATNIPPHNLNEVIEGCLMLLKDPETTIAQLHGVIKGPDFPTAGIIQGTNGIYEGYQTGRGRVVMRARVHFENVGSTGKQAIIVDELPYQVNKKSLIERIASLVQEKKIEGITHLQDESDKSGMRVVVELRRGEMPEVILNNLYKHTQLQDSFGINMVALVGGRPQVLNLKQVLECFIAHRREVVTRRTRYELRKARERAHLLEGLAIALSHVDEMISLIKTSQTPAEAKGRMLEKAWSSTLVQGMLPETINLKDIRPIEIGDEYGLTPEGYFLSPVQAQAILDLRLQRLTALEQDKIVSDYKDIVEKIIDLIDILNRPIRVIEIISNELLLIKDQFGDKRRTEIVAQVDDIQFEDLITPEEMVVTLSHAGYVKRQPVDSYRTQKRGGRGKKAADIKVDDFVDQLFIANTHDHLLCFSNLGRVYWLRVYDVPEGSRGTRGKPIVNFFPMQEEEKITAVLPVKEFDASHFVVMATAAGVVKKTPLSEFSNPRKTGIIAVNLDDKDYLIGVEITDGEKDIMLFSNFGKAVRFSESDVRPMGRTARGVRGMMLGANQKIIAMIISNEEAQYVLTATENGFGKRTLVGEYTRHSRGTKGMIAISTSARNGDVVGAILVDQADEVMLVSTGGVMIRTQVEQIRETSRSAQGVSLISLDKGTKLASLEKVAENPDAMLEDELGSGELI